MGGAGVETCLIALDLKEDSTKGEEMFFCATVTLKRRECRPLELNQD